MGNHTLERRSSSPTKMPSKFGRQKLSVQEINDVMLSMKQTELVSFLKGHHLLRTCSSTKVDQLPQPGDLVWARIYKSVYWPAFIAHVVDREDFVPPENETIDPTVYTFVMFLEESFRFAALPWTQIIACQDFELQRVLIPKFNRLVAKPGCKLPTRYKHALTLIDEFYKMPPTERQKSAENRFKIEKEFNNKKKKAVVGPKATPEAQGKQPAAQEISKVVSQTRVKKKSGLRVSDRIVTKQIGKIKSQSATTAKKKTEKPVEEKAPAKPTKPNKHARPNVGGEVLKQWTNDRFGRISKQYAFESTKPMLCCECNIAFEETEEVKMCHGLPHHGKCLIAADNESASPKCSMCTDQLCFLCKRPSEEAKVAYKCSRCDLRFHIDCLLNEWPQAEIQGSNGPITCPVHFCHTCLGEQKIFGKFRDYTTNPSRAYKCLLCLSTYHKSCLPAGCGEDIQGKEYIICPRHKLPQLKVQQRRIGCLTCYKALKPKQERVECFYCIQSFHPACVGYTGEICERLTLDVFAKDYKCFSCRWGLFPLYGQVVWYQQPSSQYWPARILYPIECKRRSVGVNRLPGQYSIEYFGGTSFYDNASRVIPLHLTTIEIFKGMKVYHDTPKILRAHEEAAFFLQFTEKYRDKCLPQPKPIYKKIERNVYRTVAAQKVKEPSDICSCAESDKSEFVCLADSGCTNRDMEMECSDRICKGGSRCTNRMFTERKNDHDFLEQRLFLKKGWGVVAKKHFDPGDFVSEYRGEVIDRHEMLWRLSKKEEEDPMYILEISKEFFIDAEYIGNLSRLINHSCNPNSEVRKYLSQGRSVGGIFAKRHIGAGEEVTFDYGCGTQTTAPFRCRCGASGCLVFVGKEVPEGFQADDEIDLNIDKWDDVCSKCGFGGRVICCEFSGCGKVWHYQCIGLSRQPRENWCCPEHPVTTQFRKKKLSSLSRSKTVANVKSVKSKIVKTEEAPQPSTNSTVPKKQSHKAPTPQALISAPKSAKPTDNKADAASASRKRKCTVDSSETCSPSKKLKTVETSSEAVTPVTHSAFTSSRRSLRSSKASDSAETTSVTSVQEEASTPIVSMISDGIITSNGNTTDDIVNEEQQPEHIERRRSSGTQQHTTPVRLDRSITTRSTRKRKVNGLYDSSCESSPLITEEQDDKPTPSTSFLDAALSPEVSLTKLDITLTMKTPTTTNRRSTNRAPRNCKLNEPLNALALNSNLPPRERNSLHARDPILLSDKNGMLRSGMKTRSSSNGSYQESQVYGENSSRRSSNVSISVHSIQPVVALEDIKHEVTNGFNEAIPIISDQKFSIEISHHKKHVNG